MSDLIVYVNSDNFESVVLKSNLPVLVDFWAEWCGPCKMIAPILEEVAASHKGKIVIAKINVDESQDLAANFSVRGIPSLLLFKGGNVEATKIGALTKSQLITFIDSNI